LVPKIPKQSSKFANDEDDNLENEMKTGESQLDLTEREKDYREWLAESLELHHGAILNLQAEIEMDDESEERNASVSTPGKLLNLNSVFRYFF
jgi:hypothetical protein